MQDITLSTVDLVIVAVYFLLVFFIGFRMARRTHSTEDLFLAGRLTVPPSPQQVARFTYRPEILARTVPGPWWQDYRAQAAVLLLTLWLVVAFW